MTSHDLTTNEAWERLRTVRTGRIITTGSDGTIDVFPVTFTTHNGEVLIATRLGTKLRNLAQHPDTVFEADHEDHGTHEAWSVVIHADARIEPTDSELRHAARAHLAPAVDVGADQLIALVPRRVSGRRFVLHDPTA